MPTIFDIAGIEEQVQIVPIVRDHDQFQKVGQTSRIDYSGGKIRAEGSAIHFGIDLSAKKIVDLSKRGAQLDASIRSGLIAPEDIETIESGAEVEINGQTFRGPVLVIRRWQLREISIVTLGANAGTHVEIQAAAKTKSGDSTVAKFTKSFFDALFKNKKIDRASLQRIAQAADDAAGEPPKDCACSLEEFCAQNGIDLSTATESELALATKIYDALSAQIASAADEEPPKEGEAADGEEPPKEGECADEEPPKEGEAADGETDEEPAKPASAKASVGRFDSYRSTPSVRELNARNYTRYQGTINHSQNGPHAGRVAEAALLMTGGVSADRLKTLKYTDREIDAACSGSNQNLTLRGLGYQTGAVGVRSTNPAEDFAGELKNLQFKTRLEANYRPGQYRQALAAGNLSTIDIPNVLANVLYKSLLNGIQAVDDFTDKISKVTTANDTKEQLFYTLNLKGEFERIGDNGALSSLTLSDNRYTVKPSSRGFELRLPYEIILNDDTSALVDIQSQIGRKAAIRKQKIWWETLIAGLGTITSPLTGALSIENLGTMFNAFMSRKDSDGDILGIKAKYLIVPPALYNTALNIQKETTVVATGSTNRVISAHNSLAGTFNTLTSGFIGANGSASGWSDTGYLAICDPADIPAMVVTYLKGQTTPAMKSIYGDYEIEGLKIGCWWTFGMAVADLNAVCYSNGTA